MDTITHIQYTTLQTRLQHLFHVYIITSGSTVIIMKWLCSSVEHR